MKVINADMPEPYKYETDYRKIPRKYLNPRIPKGRGSVKWQPFATIPEQYERIAQSIEEQNKIDKPILSDDQLAELNDKLAYKMFNDPETKVKYYSRGYIETLSGFIHKTDILKGVLILNTKGENIEIPLADIVYIE